MFFFAASWAKKLSETCIPFSGMFNFSLCPPMVFSVNQTATQKPNWRQSIARRYGFWEIDFSILAINFKIWQENISFLQVLFRLWGAIVQQRTAYTCSKISGMYSVHLRRFICCSRAFLRTIFQKLLFPQFFVKNTLISAQKVHMEIVFAGWTYEVCDLLLPKKSRKSPPSWFFTLNQMKKIFRSWSWGFSKDHHLVSGYLHSSGFWFKWYKIAFFSYSSIFLVLRKKGMKKQTQVATFLA